MIKSKIVACILAVFCFVVFMAIPGTSHAQTAITPVVVATSTSSVVWTTFDASSIVPTTTTAVFPSYVKSAIMSLETTDPAECQYTTSVGASYGSSAMQTFDNSGTTKHSVMLTGLSGTMTASKSYAYRVLCRDLASGETNPSTDPYLITFEIGGATILTGWPKNYLCLINKNAVSGNIPYLFDICVPKL